ncbi:flavin reductase family protein [Kitasatospora mediocidica]|uniref:flavin reductase family protein n=1 Tax=Kitasatospora mediocidica TaxID=58352 RepID=UPI0005681126|nr:flavin reductase family protein [Kitasatospora mediocidica]
MLSQSSFRTILGRFTTGVVLVTTTTPNGPVGMAVNSFTSVSLEPPLIALCAALTSTTWPSIRETGGFAVSILGEQHEDLCRVFSTRGADRFSGGDWTSSRDGHPIPADALGWLDCRISTIHPAGDHELVIATAADGAVADAAGPLVFHGGRFRELIA